jgi:hypothetical protein
MTSMNREIEQTARIGLTRLREYLEKPTDANETVARVGLAAVRTHTSAESTATRRLSAAISAAKLMGVSGEELRPVFQALSGQPPMLPIDRDRAAESSATG